MRLLEEAISSNILNPKYKDILIRNPNNYSIFFTKFDCESPCLKKALGNLGIERKDIEIQNFKDFI